MKFSNETFCITGGTGSFGKKMIERLLCLETREIRIFSRDEKKQDDMRKQYEDDRLKFLIGDVRNPLDLTSAFENVDYVFHAAALKQVPSCEFFPEQAIMTNIEGTRNAVNAAKHNGVKKFVLLSTDKAVYPINAMGMTKALAEKVVQAEVRRGNAKTKFMITRYGNVMASRGSVIPLFIEQLKSGNPITITNAEMTRFLMSLDDSIELVLFAFLNGESGNIYIHKAPSCKIGDLAESLSLIFDKPNHTTLIGTRHGEKLYETLVSEEEMATAQDHGRYYSIPLDERDLNYEKFFEKGAHVLQKASMGSFNSHNAEILNGIALKSFLASQKFIMEKFGV